MGRRLAVLAPFALAACRGEEAAPREYGALRYDYLTRLGLNVAEIGYGALPPAGPLDAQDPAPPGPSLLQLVQDRLIAAGSSGRATVTVGEARIERVGDGLDGGLGVRVDIVSADGGRTAFAEARVARRATGVGRDLRGALYDMTRQMLDDMNVELEFQLRRSLKDYLQATTTSPPPGAVQQQELPAPGGRAVP